MLKYTLWRSRGLPLRKRPPVIAIDGPAGAGKSTVARIIAERLKLLYIDTGAMYRALTLKAIREGIDLKDADLLTQLAEKTDIQLTYSQAGGIRVYCDCQEVTGEIRTPEVSRQVSLVAGVPGVRKEMVRQQRNLGSQGGIVMDGRDIGSEVFPDADFKFFLTASPCVRAKRRQLEMAANGCHQNLEEIEKEMIERDRQDTERQAGPLIKVPEAIAIDTTDLSLEQVVEKMLERINGGEK